MKKDGSACARACVDANRKVRVRQVTQVSYLCPSLLSTHQSTKNRALCRTNSGYINFSLQRNEAARGTWLRYPQRSVGTTPTSCGSGTFVPSGSLKVFMSSDSDTLGAANVFVTFSPGKRVTLFYVLVWTPSITKVAVKPQRMNT